MGLFWDLVQQSQISDAHGRTQDLESRVVALENELYQTRQSLHELMLRLEQHFGQDLNRDGRVGG